jgi:hypothetical protein
VGKNFFPHIFGFYLKATVSPQKDSLLTVALFCPLHSAPSASPAPVLPGGKSAFLRKVITVFQPITG